MSQPLRSQVARAGSSRNNAWMEESPWLAAYASMSLSKRFAVAAHSRSPRTDRKSTRLNSSHDQISYAVFCLKKKKKKQRLTSVTKVSETQRKHSSRASQLWTERCDH